VVYVTGLEEGLFPYRAADEGLFSSSEEELAEERRLCYVAMTRARKRLLLTRAVTRRLFGATRVDPPSRFLADVPHEIFEDLTPARPQVSLLDRAPARRRTSRAPSRPADEVWIDHSFDQSAEPFGYRPGQAVRHARFGAGTVVAVHAGARPKVEVRFPAFGTKTIIADYLEPG
jgi:DNA helicase-2/ATP-dependent DNA helicase PcrA